jgi:hypothetical protein
MHTRSNTKLNYDTWQLGQSVPKEEKKCIFQLKENLFLGFLESPKHPNLK